MTNPKLAVVMLFLMLVPIAASALTVSFVDNSILGSQNVVVRYNNGSYLGTYNTTIAVLTLDANESYIFQMQSQPKDYISNPVSLVTDLATYASTNMPALIVLAFVGAIVLLGLRRR
jgi:predicted PurR-regulated permease PerM